MKEQKISLLIISNYMLCPPLSGGVKRLLFPAMNFPKDSGFAITHMYMCDSYSAINKNNAYLKNIPVVSQSIGVLASTEFQVNTPNVIKGFSNSTWYTVNREFLDQVVAEISRNHYDIIEIIHPQLAWILPYIRPITNAKFVMDCQNIEWLIFERWIQYADIESLSYVRNEYTSLKAWETSVLDWFDYILCISPIEAGMIEKNVKHAKVLYVPSGASINDQEYYPPDGIKQKKYDLLFIGSMNWFPNAHALKWFINEALPIIQKDRTETKLEIIGSGDPDPTMTNCIKQHPAITFWGSIRDERVFLHQSKVFISPIWIGAGVRLKNPTAWAAKLPVVATTLSVEGLEYTDGHDVLIGDTPERFAAHILRLLENEELRTELAENAYTTYKRLYSLERLIDIWINAFRAISEN